MNLIESMSAIVCARCQRHPRSASERWFAGKDGTVCPDCHEPPVPHLFRWTFGDVVYLKIRAEKVAGMITGMFLRPNGSGYYVSWANTGQEGSHYEFELVDEFEPTF